MPEYVIEAIVREGEVNHRLSENGEQIALFYGLSAFEYARILKCVLDNRQKIYNRDVPSELIEALRLSEH
jgi:hypothetical protein